MVEYSTEVELLKPTDQQRGNHVLLFEVNNRGVNAGSADDLRCRHHRNLVADRDALTSPGDGHLLRDGYTMVWWGWEMDVQPGLEPDDGDLRPR